MKKFSITIWFRDDIRKEMEFETDESDIVKKIDSKHNFIMLTDVNKKEITLINKSQVLQIELKEK